MTRYAAGAAIALFLTLSGVVQAQDVGESKTGSIALNQFDPAPTGDKFFGIPSPYAHGALIEPRVQLVFDYAHEPLRLRDAQNEGAVVASQTFMHVSADAAIVDRLLVSVLFPVALAQSGDDPTIQGIQVASPQESQAGDMRFGLRVRIFGEPETEFQIGTGAFLYVPTGDTTLGEGSTAGAGYAGEGAVRIQPYLSVGGRFTAGIDWLYNAYGGPFITASDNPSTIRYGAGVAAVFLDDIMQVGPEFYASSPLQESRELQVTQDEELTFDSSTNAEILLGVRAQLLDFVLGVAGGPGLTESVGTPAFRLAWSVGYSPGAEVEGDVAEDEADNDEDFILNRDDACPDAYGPKHADSDKNGCPVLDDDGDGIPNDQDACPADNGIPTEDARTHGCPPSTARAGSLGPG